MPGINLNTIKLQETTYQKKPKFDTSKWLQVLKKDIKIGNRQLSNKKRLSFYTDFHALLSSGVDIKTAFDLILDNYSKKDDKQLFQLVQQDIVKGSTLSEALQHSGRFSLYEYYSIKIGEETGRLQDVLKNLSEYLSKKIDQQRKITNAFSYPVIVLLTALAAIYFMMNFIVPMFEDVFNRYGIELPTLTRFVIKLSNGFSGYFLYFILFTILLVFIIRVIRKKTWYRKSVSHIAIHIPVFGKLIRKIHLARFCLIMELLMSARTPLLNAIQLIKKMITFYPIQHSLTLVENDILKGSSFYESLGKFKIYDKRMISLIKVAEEVNQLDKVFSRLKDQYSSEIEYQTGIISTIMEPLMIVFIGSFVGLILISMYLPMFKLSTGMGF